MTPTMVTLPLLPLAFAGADIPATVQAWSDGLDRAYAHYKSVEPAWEPDSDVFPPCPRPGEPIPTAPRSSMTPDYRAAFERDGATESAACTALRPGGWRLQMRLTPIDQRIFSPIVARVSRVSGTDAAEKVVSELVDRGMWAAKGYQALVPVGPYIVEINAPCGASGLFAYDLADAVRAAHAAAPGSPELPQQVAVSACGRRSFAMHATTDLLEEGQKPREYWGMHFPERRDQARGTQPVP